MIGNNLPPMPITDLIAERQWPSHLGNVRQARETAREVVQRYARDEADLIELAIGEACANAIEHGSPSGDTNVFILRCFVVRELPSLVFEVEDEGHEFSLTNLSLADIPDFYSECGRGLFLINTIMDEVALQSTPRGLNIRMSKHLPHLHTEP